MDAAVKNGFDCDSTKAVFGLADYLEGETIRRARVVRGRHHASSPKLFVDFYNANVVTDFYR